MDFEDVSCGECERIYTATGDQVPRLIPENGLCYCTGCLQLMLDDTAGQETFTCPEDPE